MKADDDGDMFSVIDAKHKAFVADVGQDVNDAYIRAQGMGDRAVKAVKRAAFFGWRWPSTGNCFLVEQMQCWGTDVIIHLVQCWRRR